MRDFHRPGRSTVRALNAMAATSASGGDPDRYRRSPGGRGTPSTRRSPPAGRSRRRGTALQPASAATVSRSTRRTGQPTSPASTGPAGRRRRRRRTGISTTASRAFRCSALTRVHCCSGAVDAWARLDSRTTARWDSTKSCCRRSTTPNTATSFTAASPRPGRANAEKLARDPASASVFLPWRAARPRKATSIARRCWRKP